MILFWFQWNLKWSNCQYWNGLDCNFEFEINRLQKIASEKEQQSNTLNHLNDDLVSALDRQTKQNGALRKEIQNMLLGSYTEKDKDYQIAYVPIYKEYPFPASFSDAQVLANRTMPEGALAIIRVLYYTGQMDS